MLAFPCLVLACLLIFCSIYFKVILSIILSVKIKFSVVLKVNGGILAAERHDRLSVPDSMRHWVIIWYFISKALLILILRYVNVALILSKFLNIPDIVWLKMLL